MKHSLNGLICRLKKAEDRVSQLVNAIMETNQYQKKKKSEKNEQSFSNLKYNVMHTNTHKWSPREQEQSGKNNENTLSLGKS